MQSAGMVKNFLGIRRRLLERAREKRNDSCRRYNLFRYIAREHELSHLMIVQFYGSARQNHNLLFTGLFTSESPAPQ